MKLIVGLGNPGVRYQGTRHNIGFQIADRLAEKYQVSISTKHLRAFYGIAKIDSQEVILAKPMTFMNRSGEAVRRIVDFFHIGLEDLIVVHDDLDLPFGRLRFKRRGGDGGHQGIRSIIEAVGKNTFLRLKVGIGRPPRGVEPAEYVLGDFDEVQKPYLEELCLRAGKALVAVLLDGLETAMNRYHYSPFSISMKILPR